MPSKLGRLAVRDRDWLWQYAHQPAPDHPRARIYLDRLVKADRVLDLTDPGPTISSRHHVPYHSSRYGARMIGLKALLYRTPGTRLHHHRQLLAEILWGLKTFERKQQPDGYFRWGNGDFKPHHETGWRFEPLIWARLWLEPYLARKDRNWIDAMIARAVEPFWQQLQERRIHVLQYCNRGCVWIAVGRLAGMFLHQNRFLDEADQAAEDVIHHTLDVRGQALENVIENHGGGPDIGYGFTIFSYVMQYRLLSGRRQFDPRIIQSLRWFCQAATRNGTSFVGPPSVRYVNPWSYSGDLQPGLEYYAPSEPVFLRLADHLLADDTHNSFHHVVHPYIWAMYEAADISPPEQSPCWYADYEEHFSHPSTEYSLIGHRYRTALTHRGVYGFKGMQTFAWGEEPPIVHMGRKLASTTLAGDLDSAKLSVDGGDEGWEIFRRDAGEGDGYQFESAATVITTRRRKLWECHLFTPASAIYLAGLIGRNGPLERRWVLGSRGLPTPLIQARGRRMIFPGHEGTIAWLAGQGVIESMAHHQVLRIRVQRGPLVCGLGGSDLQLLKLDRQRQRLVFRDASGRYEFSLKHMVRPDGLLDRDPWPRIWRR